jgi:hypothetical protein
MGIPQSKDYGSRARLSEKMAGVGLRRNIVCLFVLLAVAYPIRSASATTGGPTDLHILGWSTAQSSVLISFIPGGENEEVEFLAFNLKEQVIEKTS